jgi:Ca2+-transporting ATPase
MTRLPHCDPDNPFDFTLQQLESLVDRKDLGFLQQLQGVEGLARGLHTSLTRGLTDPVSSTGNNMDHTPSSSFYLEKQQHATDAVPTFTQRQQVFGTNTLPTMDSNSLLQLMWIALQDKTLVSKR